MKSNKDLRGQAGAFGTEDLLKKATKLEPIKKNGKDKRVFINDLDNDEDIDLKQIKKKESVLDYFDDDPDREDDEEDEDWDEEDLEDDFDEAEDENWDEEDDEDDDEEDDEK